MAGEPVNGRIYLFRHVADLARGEQRNVGVAVEIAREDGAIEVVSRFLNPTMRNRRSREGRALRTFVDSTSGYDEWHEYWTRLLNTGSEGLAEAVHRQKMSFPVLEAGAIWQDSLDADAHVLADRYFEKLVLPPAEADTAGGPDSNLADRVVTAAGLRTRSDFFHGYRVPSSDLDPPRTFRFPYALVNGQTTVMARLPRAGEATVEQTLYRFEHIAANVHKIALIDSARTRNLEATSYLEDVADIVDVSAGDAVERLLEAID